MGFFTASDADLETLPTLPLPTRAYHGGPGGSHLLARRPVYVAPEAGLVHGLACEIPAPGQYLGDTVHWVLRVNFPAGEGLQIGHLWKIARGIGPGGTICYPAGEILERTPGSLLIKWRDIGFSAVYSGAAYQRAAYILDSSGLKVWWGEFSATPAGALAPPLLPATPCDGVTVVCYDHTYHAGY